MYVRVHVCACACTCPCPDPRLAHTRARTHTTYTQRTQRTQHPTPPTGLHLPASTLTARYPHLPQVRCLVLDLRCDPNSACRQALRPLRIRIRARSERSVSRQSRAVIPLSALRMVAPLGCGAWARVQLAEHAASGEAFALKTISKREVLRRGTLDVVMKERRLVRMCAHPNVVELYTSYQDADSVHLLFEHLPGGELGALLRRTGPLDQAAASFYAASVLSALEAVHDAGVVPPLPPPPLRHEARTPRRPTLRPIRSLAPPLPPLLCLAAPPLVCSPACLLLPSAAPTCPLPAAAQVHRDVRPENLLLDAAGYVKLLDFGFATEAAGDERAATLCGCTEYLAPEIVSGEGHGAAVDWRARLRARVRSLPPRPPCSPSPPYPPPPSGGRSACSCTSYWPGRRRTPSATPR